METVLEVRNARHRYGDTVALDGVDLELLAGECVALLGPNGAGKTTLVNLVTGLLPSFGAVRIGGGDPRVAATRRRLAEDPNLTELRVEGAGLEEAVVGLTGGSVA